MLSPTITKTYGSIVMLRFIAFGKKLIKTARVDQDFKESRLSGTHMNVPFVKTTFEEDTALA